MPMTSRNAKNAKMAQDQILSMTPIQTTHHQACLDEVTLIAKRVVVLVQRVAFRSTAAKSFRAMIEVLRPQLFEFHKLRENLGRWLCLPQFPSEIQQFQWFSNH